MPRPDELKSVLVTGAAGFIGSSFVIELLRRHPKTLAVGLDSFNTHHDIRLLKYRAAKVRETAVEFIRGDVCNSTLLGELFNRYGFTHVVHLAAQAGVRNSLDHPQAFVADNIMCTVNLLEVLRKAAHPAAYIYASSSSVYGHSERQPFSESHALDQPASPYAVTKRACEDLAYTCVGGWLRADLVQGSELGQG